MTENEPQCLPDICRYIAAFVVTAGLAGGVYLLTQNDTAVYGGVLVALLVMLPLIALFLCIYWSNQQNEQVQQQKEAGTVPKAAV